MREVIDKMGTSEKFKPEFFEANENFSGRELL
jgi:hypothetical protein